MKYAVFAAALAALCQEAGAVSVSAIATIANYGVSGHPPQLIAPAPPDELLFSRLETNTPIWDDSESDIDDGGPILPNTIPDPAGEPRLSGLAMIGLIALKAPEPPPSVLLGAGLLAAAWVMRARRDNERRKHRRTRKIGGSPHRMG